ncbi:hypothetical protein RYX36_034690 [Vicia faba]
MDENYLYAYFGNTGKMTYVKVIRNQQSRWDTFSAGERSFRQDEGPDRTIFMGDLVVDVSDYLLQEAFRARFNSVKGPKVVIYRPTRRSKGFWFREIC